MFAEDVPAKVFMRFLRVIPIISYERFGLAHGYEFRHYLYIVRRYLLRKDFEISCHFLLFHLFTSWIGFAFFGQQAEMHRTVKRKQILCRLAEVNGTKKNRCVDGA